MALAKDMKGNIKIRYLPNKGFPGREPFGFVWYKFCS